MEECIYEPLKPISGAVSAEHGIGLEKKNYLHISRSETEINLMKSLKKALDPNNILNPGKVFDWINQTNFLLSNLFPDKKFGGNEESH